MDDKLTGILKYFSLRARVFQAGLLCHSASYDAGDGLGYIHVLRAGTLKVSSPGKAPIQLTEPSLIFYMAPSSTHHLQPAAANTELVCASFDFGLGLKNPLAQALPDAVVLKLDEAPSLNASLQLLFTEAHDEHSGHQSLLDRLIEVVIIQLLRELIDKNHLQVGLLAGLAEPRLAKAILAMHAEPARTWTLEELSSIAGMSRASFSTTFRKLVGMPPGHYLNEWRIGVAQTLLRRGKSLQFVANAIGYTNASALSRAFTAVVGLSPSKWKKQH